MTPSIKKGGNTMGIFTRFRDIISSNINSMLDKAEDPEKLIKLMIREMEDTLVEIKTACAAVMASSKKVQRQLDGHKARARLWEQRAALAVNKGRDDLAREALVEKRKFTRRTETFEHDLVEQDLLIEQYQDDIRQLEEKLKSARDKQRMLVQRHVHAQRKMQAQQEMRRIDSSETIMKFDEIENRIERMEAEADLVNFGKKTSLEDQIERLSVDDEIESELAALKRPINQKEDDSA
jgi:phage shock protein A